MEYNLGIDGKYFLDEKAIEHILNGDFSERQEKNVLGKTKLVPVISGGLHTFKGWESFLKLRNDVTHGLLVDENNFEKWYYARKLQNGVILLKIPKDCFQSKAANITMYPETFYKSGYLWKTLFPLNFNREKIVSYIDDALKNIDKKESDNSLIIGYANKENFFKSMKIRIQVRGNKILSAFPTWEQPMTGNNGKPFSHIDAINTIISSSCIFTNDDSKKYLDNTIKYWNKTQIDDLCLKCPDIIKNREIPKNDSTRETQLSNRITELKEYGEAQDEKKIKKLIALCFTDEYSRHTFDFIRFVYQNFYKEIKNNLQFKNSLSLYQNLQELLIIVNAWDLKNSNTYTISIIEKLLKVRFIRTGGLDQWEMKRLSNLIIQIIDSYEDTSISLKFLNFLINSPLRIAFYSEFNLNKYFVKKPELIGFTSNPSKSLSDKHFYDFVSQNLGINYTSNFKDDFNLDLAKKVQLDQNPYGLKMIKDFVSHSIGTDFNYFSMELARICKSLIIEESTIKTIEKIVYDYHRCIAANILRIIVKHKNLLSLDLEFGDKKFVEYTKAKHEYKFLWLLNRIMIEEISECFKKYGFNKKSSDLESKFMSLYEEVRKIPMPKGIPKYLQSDEVKY